MFVSASGRPDLYEWDLRRLGGVVVRIPVFPAATPEEGFHWVRALGKRRGMLLEPGDLEVVRARSPDGLTAGAAEALAVKVYRMVKTKQLTPQAALAEALETYQPAVSRETMEFQVGLAVSEASDLSFVPESLRPFGNAEG